MTLIACVDSRMGLSFNHRRLSRDRIVTGRIVQIVGDGTLRVHPYSASLFAALPESRICASEDFLSGAGPDDFCFLETGDPLPDPDRITRVLLFQWNRTYPFDVTFPLDLSASGWTLESREEFPGSSHENITLEVYRRA